MPSIATFPGAGGPGDAGDQLRRRLAAQLARLDLVEPAAALLGELVERPLSGAARAEVGAELAALWLRGPDPGRRSPRSSAVASETICRRVWTGAAGCCARAPWRRRSGRQRLWRCSTAHANSGEQHLAAEILWQIRDWPRLAATLEDLLGRRADADGALSDEEQGLVLRLAVAYGQQADGAALERLRARFGAAMSGRPREPAFLMATMTPGRPLAPEAILAVAAEHLDRVRDYLAAGPAAP